MSLPGQWSCKYFDSKAGRVADYQLPLLESGEQCTVKLAPIPGASALQLLLYRGEARIRAEVRLGREIVNDVSFVLTCAGERLHVATSLQSCIILPGDDAYEPFVPSRGGDTTSHIQLIFLVDASTIRCWREMLDRLAVFANKLSKASSVVQTAVLSFSDSPLAIISAPDLQPVSPISVSGERSWQSYSDGVLKSALSAIRPSPGVDWVDALADGLHLCCELPWAGKARKIVCLAGDSPGFSLREPLPAACDAHVRSKDVDHESEALARYFGVEIATLFVGLESTAETSSRRLIDKARDQYRRIASLPDWSWDWERFVPEAAAESLLHRPAWLARGSCYGSGIDTSNGGN